MVMASLLIAAGLFHSNSAFGAQLQQRSVTIADGRISATTQYAVRFSAATAETVGSVRVEFCSNTALPDELCTAPSGFDLRDAVLAAEYDGMGAAIIGPMTTANMVIITEEDGKLLDSGDQLHYVLDNVRNPDIAGSIFARITTYAALEGSGPPLDQGSTAMDIGDTLRVEAEVPPYLTFCVGTRILGTDCSTAQGNFINLGVLEPGRTGAGTIDMLAATNAANGYTIRITGNTLASGNNTITTLPVPTPSAPGNNQFGINLRVNSSPSVGKEPSGPGQGSAYGDYARTNLFTYRSGDVIASSPVADDFRRYTTSYILNVGMNQPAGVYNSTFTYIGLASF